MPTLTTEKEPYGYWIEISGIQFTEGLNTTWIQAFPMGTWEHPVYGTIEMDAARAKRFADNVNLKVREQDLDIDYDHKADNGKAAGWVKMAEARDTGLWILVEWTPVAKQSLADKEYRYFSPEFADEWTSPKGITFKDVLFGGAITNRPFLKDILPINLSEVASHHGGQVDELMKALAASLGLDPEKVTPEELVAKVTELNKVDPPAGSTTEPAGTTTTTVTTPETKPEPVLAGQLSEEALTKLLAEHPLVKALQDQVVTLQTSNRLSEVDLQITKLSEGKKFAVPPAAEKALRETVVGLPKAQGDAVLKMFSDILTAGLVPLGEAGHSHGNGSGESVTKQFTEKIGTLMASDPKIGYADAIEKIGREHPQLWEDYRREQLTEVNK